MIQIVYLIITTILLLICITLQILSRYRLIFKEEEYVVATKHLEMIINCYKTTMLEPKIAALQQNHDLDKTSQVNSIKAFAETHNKLISQCAGEILKKHVNRNSRKILAKYFSEDGLILFVITNLKG